MHRDLEKQLVEALAECERLRTENAELRKRLTAVVAPVGEGMIPPVTNRSSAPEKVKLFRSLFRGRDDVFAVRWQSRNGKAGYSPACSREPGSKEAKEYFPLTDEVIRQHLIGKSVVGVYPLLKDDRCWFLAVDFDKRDWVEDVREFLQTCEDWGVPAALERSRSGKGAHVWVFFASAIEARMARQLGTAMLTWTMERRHLVGLGSYDRCFPSQDTLPQGGFGNLIALPLQHRPREEGNSVFVDVELRSYEDQWAYLSSLHRMSLREVEQVVEKAAAQGCIVGVRECLDDEEKDPWLLPPSRRPDAPPISGPLPATVKAVRSNQFFIEKAGLPSAMLNRLQRLAAFQNPEFYRAQAMRLSTYGKPRIVHCAEEFPRHLALPRGSEEEALELLKGHGIGVEAEDRTVKGIKLNLKFHGRLRPDQLRAGQAVAAADHGVLSATTAFGKTVIGAWLIARRDVNTLIVVHRQQLLDQWRERLAEFLGLPKQKIGKIGGGARKVTGEIDVALMQSLNRRHRVDDLVANYGHVIVDECHHVSAVSFESIMREVKARYVTGLTATPLRKDGHHPIIFMQCGPIRHRVNAKAQAKLRPFNHWIVPRPTDLRILNAESKPPIHEIYEQLITNEKRNQLIVKDVLAAVRKGRSPIVLTERVNHVLDLAQRLRKNVRHVIVLRGGIAPTKRQAELQRLESLPKDAERVIVATGAYVGEGFDDARLDTLFLAMPISWKGTLQQYAGRLHRLHAGKREVVIFDYVDGLVPQLERMFLKRRKGYDLIGYEVRDDWDGGDCGRNTESRNIG